MPSCHDVYVRLPRLDRQVVEEFLTRHVPGWRAAETWRDSDYAEILRDGLAGRPSRWPVYAGVSQEVLPAELVFVVVAFGVDGGVVLGVSVHESRGLPFAERWLDRLLGECGASEGFVQWEERPPVREEDWRESVGRALASRP